MQCHYAHASHVGTRLRSIGMYCSTDQAVTREMSHFGAVDDSEEAAARTKSSCDQLSTAAAVRVARTCAIASSADEQRPAASRMQQASIGALPIPPRQWTTTVEPSQIDCASSYASERVCCSCEASGAQKSGTGKCVSVTPHSCAVCAYSDGLKPNEVISCSSSRHTTRSHAVISRRAIRS